MPYFNITHLYALQKYFIINNFKDKDINNTYLIKEIPEKNVSLIKDLLNRCENKCKEKYFLRIRVQVSGHTS